MDFSNSSYPTLSNSFNHRDVMPSSKYLNPHHLSGKAEKSNNPNNRKNTVNNEEEEEQSNTATRENRNDNLDEEETTRKRTTTSNLRSMLKRNETSNQNPKHDDKATEDSEFSLITPQMAFKYTRDFVSQHPYVFFFFLLLFLILCYIIYLQHQQGANLPEILAKHGLWFSPPEEEQEEEIRKPSYHDAEDDELDVSNDENEEEEEENFDEEEESENSDEESDEENTEPNSFYQNNYNAVPFMPQMMFPPANMFYGGAWNNNNFGEMAMNQRQ
jgi:hypothetical protein